MLKHIRMSLLVVMIGIFAFTGNVFAESKNEVKLNFDGGIIRDGYIEYSKIGKIQLFKGDDLVINITNNMVVDLNESEYKFVIEEIEDSSVSGANIPIKLNINNWYYSMTKIIGETRSTFKLESSKFSGTLDVKLVRTITAINTKVENVYENITSKGVIDLTDGKEYVIDFSKDDELTKGLKIFADLEKTLYYKNVNGSLLITDNESEAVIKIVGNESENKAILTAVNVENKKSDIFKGLYTKYTGSKLTYTGSDGGILNEIRTDYYTRCTYEFTFQYVKEEVSPKEYKFIEGANQIYTIDESKNAIFRIDEDFSLFDKKVYIDNVLVGTENYKAESGSTIITLSKEYVDTLSAGEHTIKVEFNDGGEATTKFEVKAKKANNKNIEDISNSQTVNNKNVEDISNPQTGDDIALYLATGILSIIGLAGVSVIVYRKKQTN